MKILLIGMDGVGLEAFSRGWTPYISSLIAQGKSLELKEDLIMRGWLEIVTGKNGVETGALYDRPKANGSYEWNLKFGFNEIPGLGKDIKPIWQVLNEMGYKVGVMNVPTIFPATKVDGFMVSGGGGGAPVVQTPTPEHCYPIEENPLLVEDGYIVDERIVPMLVEKKITDMEDIFSILKNKNERKTHSFIRLANKYKIDFGFLVYRSSSNLAEWLLLPEWKRFGEGAEDVDHAFIDTIKTYYRHFDSEIKKLHAAFPNTQIIFAADHSLVPRVWDVNPNIFLQELHFQKSHLGTNFLKQAINIAKKFVPFSLRAKLRKKNAVHNALYCSTSFVINETAAFCKTQGDSLQGIFINDKERFNGPVKASEFGAIQQDIIKAFNSHPLSKLHGLIAYTKEISDSSVAKYFPDIVIDVPDGYLITDRTHSFVKEFTPARGPLNLLSITKGELLCIKGHKPIAVVYNGGWKVDVHKEPLDLRAVYEHVVNSFQVKKNDSIRIK